MLKNTRNQYGSVSKILHWVIFILVCFMLLSGYFGEDLPKSWRFPVIMTHKSTGLLIFGLMIVRLVWRWRNMTPTLEQIASWERGLAHLVHVLLYLVLFAIPLSGWIMSTAAGKAPVFYGLAAIPFPGIQVNEALSNTAFSIHEILAYVFLFLLASHIIGALKHHLIDKNDVLTRMM